MLRVSVCVAGQGMAGPGGSAHARCLLCQQPLRYPSTCTRHCHGALAFERCSGRAGMRHIAAAAPASLPSRPLPHGCKLVKSEALLPHADASVHWVQPQTAFSRRLQPRIPLADAAVTPQSAAMLQKWRVDACDPHTARHFDAAARAPRTPHLRSGELPAQSVLLDATVLPDASTAMDSSGVKGVHEFHALVRRRSLTCRVCWHARRADGTLCGTPRPRPDGLARPPVVQLRRSVVPLCTDGCSCCHMSATPSSDARRSRMPHANARTD